MVRIVLLGVAVFLVAADAKVNVDRDEIKKLQGTWVMETGEKDGKKLPDDVVKASKITWNGADIVVETPHQSKEPIKATAVALDPGRKPREMTWKRSVGPDAGKEMHAIYEWLDNNRYRICFAPAGKDRPTEFKTLSGSGHMLHTWKRVK